MGLTHYINKKFKKYFQKKVVRKNYRIPTFTITDIKTPLLLGVNIKSKENTVLARAIGRFSQYKNVKITHFVPVFCGNIENFITDEEYYILREKLTDYYRDWIFIEDIKQYVLCSADDNGMNYFDFSQYQERDFSLSFITADRTKIRLIIQDLIKLHDCPYDCTGLVYKLIDSIPVIRYISPIFKWFDDKKAVWCSELDQIFKKYDCQISYCDDSTPADIERYCDENGLIIYQTPGWHE